MSHPESSLLETTALPPPPNHAHGAQKRLSAKRARPRTSHAQASAGRPIAMLGPIILAGACAAIATGATAGPAVRLGELAPVEVVEWTGAEPFASVFADRDRPVVLRATR